MHTVDVEPLRQIKTLQSLVKYLHDKLDWPIGVEEIDDLTFDYTPDELGLDFKHTAKIKEIKQLRPLNSKQPWGIFWVNFEKKRLPMVVLRRILGNLVIKRRAGVRKADRPSWNLNDLLFISSYGEEEHRNISFAHFSEDPTAEELPVLRILGWDDQNSIMHLDRIANQLHSHFRWPNDSTDIVTWRKNWLEAFTDGYREPIRESNELIKHLADLAANIRRRVRDVLDAETERGPMRQLFTAIQKLLIHDMSEDGFADMYAQTVAYGLLSTRFSRPAGLTAQNLIQLTAISNPFLENLLENLFRLNKGKFHFDVDEVGINDVLDLLRNTNIEAIKAAFSDKNPSEDPVIRFYEGFLKQYDPQQRVKRGVFFTPRPVVSYIVRSIHELLKTEFGLEDGLASIDTWADIKKRLPELKIPEGAKPSDPFVCILDPATGTGTFLYECIEVIERTMKDKWCRKSGKQNWNDPDILKQWREYVPQHLLSRLFGYELMMSPYSIAHLKLALKLGETGYQFQEGDRLHIYLTNSLEPPSQLADFKIADMFSTLATEAQEVNELKVNKRFTVVIGNPPYSGVSANMSDAIIELVKPYKSINGVSLGERKIWAQDDYKKFIRFSQLSISHSGCGILGFITNHGFINEPTSRGMRHNLLGTFSRLSVLDLHGSLKKREVCPDGSPDKNVFDIEPGVAISFFRRGGASPDSVTHSDMWGLQEVKYDYLQQNTLNSTKSVAVSPSAEFYLFVPQSEDAKIEFSQLVSITEVFESGSNGIQTSRDHVVYGFSRSECYSIIEEFRAPERAVPTSELRGKYWFGKKVASYDPGDTRGWRVSEARDELRRDKKWESKFKRALYRPFDFQTLFYSDYMIDWPRSEIMSQMLRPNLSLCVGRAGSAADNQEWNIVFVANTLVDMNLFYRGGNVNYPLLFAPISGCFDFDGKPRPNFKPAFLKTVGAKLGISQTVDFGLPHGLTPEDIFHYAYAVFHSPGYRSRYAEFLKIDFPRLPLTGNLELFRALARLGGDLVTLHLLESPKLDKPITEFIGGRNPEVEKISWSKNTVWVDKARTTGFKGVREDVWNFHIGGYQVCEKWLKDRKGRKLSEEDINHYQKIVVALSETIRLMAEIDKVIDHHGGWPKAFENKSVK